MNPLAVYNAMYYDQRIEGHDDDHRPRRREHRPDHRRRRDRSGSARSRSAATTSPRRWSRAFKLNFAKAEELKRNAATSKYARQIFQAMRPVFADLVAEIQRSIGFYASVHRDSRIKQDHRAGRDVPAAGPAEVPPAEPAARRGAARHARRRRPGRRQAGRDVPATTSSRSSARTAWRCRRWARGRSPARCCRRTSAGRRCGRKRPSGSAPPRRCSWSARWASQVATISTTWLTAITRPSATPSPPSWTTPRPSTANGRARFPAAAKATASSCSAFMP